MPAPSVDALQPAPFRSHLPEDALVGLHVHGRRLDGLDLLDHADQLPQEPDTVSRVRQAIEGELRGGSPKLETVARQLAMSPRTLQRRLKDEGVVFNDLLDHLRFRAAKDYLAQRDIAGSEVAYLLGFAEPSSFNHAFKCWTGQTPTEYRRQAGR